MALKILHIADLHLGRIPRSVDLGGSNPPFDVFPTFSDICHLALQEKVDLFIIAGDLFDCANPETRLVGQVAAELRRLGSAGITVVISPGTHDTLSFSYSIFHSDPFPQAIIFKESVVSEPVFLTVREMEIYLYGIAVDPTRALPWKESFKRRKQEGFHIGVLHCTVEGDNVRPIEERYLPVKKEELLSFGLDYLALGHHHSFQTFLNAEGRVFACYPGSPEGTSFRSSELGDRFVALVEIKEGDLSLRGHKINRFLWQEKELDVSGLEKEEELAQKIGQWKGENVLLKLRLTGAPDGLLDLEKVQGLAQPEFYYLGLKDHMQIFDSSFVERVKEEKTIRGLFVRKILEELQRAQGRDREVLQKALTIGLQEFDRAKVTDRRDL